MRKKQDAFQSRYSVLKNMLEKKLQKLKQVSMNIQEDIWYII